MENKVSKKKNVIAILMDSASVCTLGNKNTEVSSTPFIDELIKHSMYMSNVYSYAPYTDAATRGMFCGNKTLDNYGYYFGINEEESNHFKIYHDAGYETIGTIYPYYIYGKEVNKSIDIPIYTSGYVFNSVWFGKLEYYANLKRQRELTDIEYKLMIRCMNYVFEGWHKYYDDMLNNENSGIVMYRHHEIKDVEESLQSLVVEETAYYKNPREYIDKLLDEGNKHPIFNVEKIDIQNCVDKDLLRDVYKEESKNFKILSNIQYKTSKRNNKINIKKIGKDFKDFIKTRNIRSFRYVANCIMRLSTIKRMQRLSISNKARWQENTSTRMQILSAEKVIENRKNTDKPFYWFCHIEEPHNYISFFSYDCDDKAIIKKEIEDCTDFAKEVGKDFKGNILYQMSLKYVDACIKELYNWLENKGILEDTIIALFADHGTSYTFYPIRKHVVNCFHTENYNIPLIVFDGGKKDMDGVEYKEKVEASVMFPTIQVVAGLNDDLLYDKSIFNKNNYKDIIVTEYMGPGVPDMLNREIWISGRSDRYVIAYKTAINKEFDPMDAYVIYDREKDPLEENGFKMTKELLYNRDVCKVVELIANRVEQIKNSTKKFINNLS